MYLQTLMKVNKQYLPKHIDTRQFMEEHKPIEHKKPSDDMKFELKELSMFKKKKSPKKKILRDHDIFKGIEKPKKISKDMSNKKSNGRNNRKTKKKSTKRQTPDLKKLQVDHHENLAVTERRKQQTAEHINKLHTSYKYTKKR